MQKQMSLVHESHTNNKLFYPFDFCDLQYQFNSCKMQKNINYPNLKALIKRYGISPEFQQFFGQSNIENKDKYSNLRLIEIEQICQKINKGKLSQLNNTRSKKKIAWMKGQFKLFIWVSAFYAFNLQISIKQFDRQDFQFLNTIFLNKSIERIRYQLKNLFHRQKSSRRRWKLEEIQLLTWLLQKYQEKQKKPQWKSISYNLFFQSKGIYFRTSGQCRQMFTNHLKQDLNKDRWTEKQDELLLSLVNENNKKWSKISQQFGGKRSGHMVKNRYLTLMKKKAKSQWQAVKKQQIKSNCQVNFQKLTQRQYSSQKLSFILFGKEIETQSFDNTNGEPQKNQEKLKSQYLWVQSFFLPQQAHECYQPFHNIKKSVDYFSSSQFSKLFDENRLLEHLGCSHYEQIQESFEEKLQLGIDFEQ